MSEPLLKPKDVAGRLNAGVSSVYRLHATGVLPGIRIPGVGLRFRPAKVEEILRQWEQAGRNGRGRRGRERS